MDLRAIANHAADNKTEKNSWNMAFAHLVKYLEDTPKNFAPRMVAPLAFPMLRL